MLWIALYLPELSLQIAARGMREDRVIVIKDGPANRPIVAAANDLAKSLGIQIGVPVAAAEALASNLLVVARNKDNETHALERLAAWALQFTPTVTLESHQGIVLEAAPSLRLQGGLDALMRKIINGCERLGYRVMYGVAPTARAAWWFAISVPSSPRRRGPSVVERKTLDSRLRGNDDMVDVCDDKIFYHRLGKLHITALRWPLQTVDLLQALGIHTIADCLTLPRAGLVQRFGFELANQIDQAMGLKPDVRPVFSTPQQFHSRIELPAEVSEIDALLFPLKRLLIEMEGFLRGLGAGVQSVRVELEQGSKQRESFSVGLLAPEREHQRLLMLISARLMNVKLERSVWALSLHAEQLQTLSGKQQSFLADRTSHQLAHRQLLERLQARLGKSKVQTIAPQSDHRPEHAWFIGNVSQREAINTFPLRPLWLLPQPRPIDGADIALIAGPERIEAGWWDGKSVQRDYYVARNGKGAVLWIYCPHRELGQWYMHGLFA